jgi:hypothetical protein
MKNKSRNITMMDVFKNPRYRGKHIILAAGRIYTAKTGDGASEILNKIRKQYPDVTPEVAYLPKAHSLILWI